MNQLLAATLITKAEQKAEELGVQVCIAITDQGGHLNAFHRMDHAFLGSIDVAVGKAKTSSLFPIPSGVFGKLIREENLLGMENSNQGLIGFGGGQPIFVDGTQIGAIGISGATEAQDTTIAEFAVKEAELDG
ncbi:heme-binding protein [Neptuniibacter sp. 1_MG-2023]|jgi:uncharacterized protein GlcG (DUF336 family)|uniref:GlcG/HbpS family heme-binding protein n=1 Tax=Neptuniibacter sp. 1_MG-2023 TaxID=3062662 RepID=UPI0026E319B4|nr:heme-binding protein [Neptuniibacter sp. 1_MG-2023]MDO6595021.1 heme-binding protein [Neptuniibacter sp. 1_MG-2023]